MLGDVLGFKASQPAATGGFAGYLGVLFSVVLPLVISKTSYRRNTLCNTSILQKRENGGDGNGNLSSLWMGSMSEDVAEVVSRSLLKK